MLQDDVSKRIKEAFVSLLDGNATLVGYLARGVESISTSSPYDLPEDKRKYPLIEYGVSVNPSMWADNQPVMYDATFDVNIWRSFMGKTPQASLDDISFEIRKTLDANGFLIGAQAPDWVDWQLGLKKSTTTFVVSVSIAVTNN